jgi:hypothetical protein
LNFALPNSDDQPPYFYPAFLAPPMIRKYDVDEVLLCLNSETNESNLSPFCQRPLDANDVPIWTKDPEFAMKPVLTRLPKGRVGEFLKLHIEANPRVPFTFSKMVADPQDRAELAYMFSRPILKLREEMMSIRTKEDRPVRFELCFFPSGSSGLQSRVEPYRSLWKSVAEQVGIPFADLSDSFLALRPDYFPVAESTGTNHPTADGYLFKALITADLLIREKWIPFQPADSQQK